MERRSFFGICTGFISGLFGCGAVSNEQSYSNLPVVKFENGLVANGDELFRNCKKHARKDGTVDMLADVYLNLEDAEHMFFGRSKYFGPVVLLVSKNSKMPELSKWYTFYKTKDSIVIDKQVHKCFSLLWGEWDMKEIEKHRYGQKHMERDPENYTYDLPCGHYSSESYCCTVCGWDSIC